MIHFLNDQRFYIKRWLAVSWLGKPKNLNQPYNSNKVLRKQPYLKMELKALHIIYILL